MADKKKSDEQEEITAKDDAEKEKASKKSLVEQLTAWVGIISVLVTVGLTIVNKYTETAVNKSQSEAKKSADKAQESATAFEQSYKSKEQDLEKSKERTERLKFVQPLLNDLSGKDEKKQKAIANLIRLALTSEESARLFAGLEASTDPNLQKIGSIGTEITNNTFADAEKKEREGFQSLINGDYDSAAAAFQASENAYNSYHNVYELARLIRANKSQMSDLAKKKEVFQKIVKDYSYGTPSDLLAQVKAIANQ